MISQEIFIQIFLKMLLLLNRDKIFNKVSADNTLPTIAKALFRRTVKFMHHTALVDGDNAF